MEMLMSYLKVFLTGGVLCLIAQILIAKTKLTPARILVGYVVAGVILGALGIYEHVVEFGKAGATVPLTGFGYSLSQGVKTAVSYTHLDVYKRQEQKLLDTGWFTSWMKC